ncbi:MAG: hypothetical protein R3D66_04470 [Alphaproteobacteria bacterium]
MLELTEEIERRTSAIGHRAQEGAESWDRATVTILSVRRRCSVYGRGSGKTA